MSANPKPKVGAIVFLHGKGSVGKTDPDRVNWDCGVNLFEMKAGVSGVFLPKSINPFDLGLDFLGETVKTILKF